MSKSDERKEKVNEDIERRESVWRELGYGNSKVSHAEKQARVAILNALGLNVRMGESSNKVFEPPTTLDEAVEQNDVVAFLKIGRKMNKR